MAKVKSFKIYNLVTSPGAQYGVVYTKFYDIEGKLILIDFNNYIKVTGIYDENSEYIVTCDSFLETCYGYKGFSVSCFDINTPLSYINGAWIPGSYTYNSSNWIKIEFKFPQYISDIQVCGSHLNYVGTESFSYQIEYDNKTTETNNYTFNYTKFCPIEVSQIGGTYAQTVLDSYFRSIPFSKSKQTYDMQIGHIETLEANNFRNIPINSIKTLKALYSKPENTLLSCVISFDKGQTWKTFDGVDWNTISDISPENIILNSMEISVLNSLNKDKLISGGFTGSLDFKIAMKTNDKNKTPSVTKIYIEYK